MPFPEFSLQRLDLPGYGTVALMVPHGFRGINTQLGDRISFSSSIQNEEFLRVEFVYPLNHPDDLTYTFRPDILARHRLVGIISKEEAYRLINAFLDEEMD